jgi:tRNA nucleotidyltransferase/poly(A) polymerase
MSKLSNADTLLLRLDYTLAKQAVAGYRQAQTERSDPAADPRAEQFEQEGKPRSEEAKEDPSGKVRTKIYELVHRGGRTFERARTAWVNPKVAEQLEQRKRASDWIRMLGNYLPIYFVGGFVRDKFFKKVSKDIDLVALVSLEEAKEVLKQINIEFTERSNSHSRLQFTVGGMKVDLISTTPDELLNNLRTRDFTINAVAQSVTGQFYDPTRGMEDIKLKWLRSPNNDSVKSFKEDPARILRGARFLADFPIKAHPSVLRGLKANSEALSGTKKRRIGFELVKIMQTEKSWLGLQFLADNDQLKFISKDLVAMEETKQRGKNHKQTNVWKHTITALKNAASTDAIVNLAILFHDIGKNKTGTDNNTHFPGHDKTGAQMTTSILTELGLPKDTVNRVSNIVENHLFMSKVGPKGDEADYKKLAVTLKGDIERFFKVSEADAKDHKEYDPKWLEITKKRMNKIKSSKPKTAGEEDTDELKKSQQYLVDESIEILLSHESGLVYVDEMLDVVGING